jgi:hypothetical protein
MPPNDGGELGKHMTAAKDKPPKPDTIDVSYEPGVKVKFKAGKKSKVVQTYEESTNDETYALQYAPHHLIPGNESLKGSHIVPFMGDDNAIGEFAEGQSSHIKDGFSIDYDVNQADNGVWLPSPYALSMANTWPSEPGINVIKKRKTVKLAQSTEAFKAAYVAASIECCDRQFHMRHKEYSTEVQTVLNMIAEKMGLMCMGECPIAAASASAGDKIDPPMGLPARLKVLSENLRRLLTGPVWRDPIFTDSASKEYATDLKNMKKTKAEGRITGVM